MMKALYKYTLICLLLISMTGHSLPQNKPQSTYKHITIQIRKIQNNMIIGEGQYPSPQTYIITAHQNIIQHYCLRDYIDVYYQDEIYVNQNQMYIYATKIIPNSRHMRPGVDYKPVIYLYPTMTQEVHVELDYHGQLIYTCPTYQDGWDIMADPDGTLTFQGKTLPYLIWEGIPHYEYDLSHGFCVAASDSGAFLESILSYQGLNKKEINDFKDFWLPVLQQSPYNILTFQQEAYTNHAKLHIHPHPDTVIRVFMTIQPSQTYVSIPKPSLSSCQRQGFTVVEWGGTIFPSH